jgi:CubicO group peptidase (beta-lactamase class C family)
MSLEPEPEVAGAPVTAYNWQDPPFNRWAFWHVDEILPTYQVSRGDGPARVLPASAAALDLFELPVARLDGSAGTAGEVLADTFTDAYVVLQDGELVTEWYGPAGVPDRPHALMSVSKSVVGCVAAALIDRGQLDADGLVSSYVPELAASGYAGATVRNVLDMRSGVAFLEEYSNPKSDIRRLDEWIGWDGSDDSEPRGLYRFLATLPAEAPHGSRFLYRSAESDVLGWVCERAAGRPMSDLISALTGPGAAGGSFRRAGSATAGPWMPTFARRSPPRRPRPRSPGAGTATSSGSGPAPTATCCSASASTARCCTSAGVRTRCA